MKGSLKDFSRYIGVSYTTARNLQGKGLPIEQAGRRGVAAVIDFDKAKAWYENEFQVPAEWKARRDQLLADKTKLEELARKRADLYKRYIAREHGVN